MAAVPANRAAQSNPRAVADPDTRGVSEDHLDGGFRKITTHQLVLSWWLYQAGHITRRQLRVLFALHEMAERRSCTVAEARAGMARRRPTFAVEEVSALVGGRGEPEALKALQGDLRRLQTVGIVTMTARSIEFAVSVDQIRIENVSGFWTMFAQFQNQSRSVPVPRRLLRALAAGFSRAVTGVILATLIRSLFWHKGKGFRVDGRTKGSWIAETFGISRRAVTDARAHLIGLGWLEAIETPQWKLNKWGSHDAINTAWSHKSGQGRAANETASPPAQNGSEIASPSLNSSPFPSGKILETRHPARPGKTGVSINHGKANSAYSRGAGPDLRNVLPEHLIRTEDLLNLHDQAIAAGLIDRSEASQLDFLAYAERARAHGTRPGALFMWLLRGKRTKFITQADEDAAHARLRDHRHNRAGQGLKLMEASSTKPRELSDDERFYLLCLQIARQQRVDDPFRVAFIGKRWTRPHWEQVKARYEEEQQPDMTPAHSWRLLQPRL